VTATNLADNVSSVQTSLVDNITGTEIQGGNLALGGMSGNNAFLIKGYGQQLHGQGQFHDAHHQHYARHG
jgi:hypothetical protein